MFSLDRFYNVLHSNLISNLPNGNSIYFIPFGTYERPVRLKDRFDTGETYLMTPFTAQTEHPFCCYFLDQEPVSAYAFECLDKFLITPKHSRDPRNINVLATSEKSAVVDQYVGSTNFYKWYYFYHGFAALDWYRDFWYADPKSFLNFDKVFIGFNHLTADSRSYRLHLAANLYEQDLMNQGHFSLFPDPNWDVNSPLDPRAKIKVQEMLSRHGSPRLIDTNQPQGSLSAMVNLDTLASGLWHIVTETVYFDPKLHLTEKIFKAIAAKRPFILVGAPGNLEYLKSYGFRTFDQWIDESYDQEPDHYIRIEKITKQIADLCALEPVDLYMMFDEMRKVLDYNYEHFYNGFRDLIVDELVDNFEHLLAQINHGRHSSNHSRYHCRYDLDPAVLSQVKKILKQ